MAINEKILKDYKIKYVRSVLAEDAKLIQDEQSKIVVKHRLFETGELSRSIRGKFSIEESGTGQKLTMNFIKYIRFLDIKDIRRKQKSYHIYNKILFGILYNSTVRKLAFGFTESVLNEMKKLDNKTLEL